MYIIIDCFEEDRLQIVTEENNDDRTLYFKTKKEAKNYIESGSNSNFYKIVKI